MRYQINVVCCALSVCFTIFSTGYLAAEEWSSDYGTAYAAAQKAGKPLLVVFEKPAEPLFRIEQVSVSASDSPSALLKPYELCRIDVTTPAGQKTAKAFGATQYPYVAITDKRVDQIVYRRSGKVSDLDWDAMLVKYADGSKPRIQFESILSTGSICRT